MIITYQSTPGSNDEKAEVIIFYILIEIWYIKETRFYQYFIRYAPGVLKGKCIWWSYLSTKYKYLKILVPITIISFSNSVYLGRPIKRTLERMCLDYINKTFFVLKVRFIYYFRLC